MASWTRRMKLAFLLASLIVLLLGLQSTSPVGNPAFSPTHNPWIQSRETDKVHENSDQNSTSEAALLDPRTDENPDSPNYCVDHRDEYTKCYDNAVERGQWFLSMLNAPDHCVTPSQWTDPQDLARYGWSCTGSNGIEYDQENDLDVPIIHAITSVFGNIPGLLSKSVNWEVLWQHNRLSRPVPNGPFYRATEAFAQLKFNRYGATIIQNVRSPRNAGPGQFPPVTGRPDDPIVPLGPFSDIAFLAQRILYSRNVQELRHLKMFLACNVINEVTLDIVVEALYQLDRPSYSWGSRTTFAKGSPGYAAILASPNGLGIAWYLIQHRAVLGWKEITSIVAWFHNEDACYLMFLIGDHDGGASGSAREREVTADDLGLRSSRYSSLPPHERDRDTDSGLDLSFEEQQLSSDHAAEQDVKSSHDSRDAHLHKRATPPSLPGNDVALVPPSHLIELWRRGDSEIYDQAVNEGKVWLEALNADVGCASVPQSTWTDAAALEMFGWHRGAIDQLDLRSTTQKFGFLAPWDELKLNYNHANNPRSTWKHIGKKVIDGVTYWPTLARHSNLYNVQAIVALNIDSPADRGPHQLPLVKGNHNSFPPLPHWSDVTFLEWQNLHSDDPNPDGIKGLKAVIHDNIRIGSLTHSILVSVASEQEQRATLWPGLTFLPNDRGFKALLGSPKGGATAALLSQHKDQLGHKVISQITIWEDESHLSYMLLRIEDFSPPADAQGQKLVVRDDGEEYNKAVQAGETLQAAMNADISCIPQSEWTDSGALDAYGWDGRRFSPWDMGLGRASLAPWDALGLSRDANKNARISWAHRTRAEVDGVTYLPTRAEYDCLYNAEAIVAIDIESPRVSGAIENPPITGNPYPLPKIAHWSDVAFLQWQLLHSTHPDPHAIKGLKAVLHESIINSKTESLIRSAVLHDKGEALGPWPGTSFTPEERGFNAILGTPNARGTAVLLAQHKAQLGHKVVWKITVWEDLTDHLNLLLLIRDYEPSGEARPPTPEPQSLKARQTVGRRGEDSPAYQEAAQLGKLLVGEMENASDCEPQRTWVHTDLAKYGRVQTSTQPANTLEDGTTAPLEYLDPAWNISSGTYIEYKHNNSSQGPNGESSEAYYDNIYSAHIIVYEDGNSPWKSDLLQDPKAKASPNESPPISTRSDVTFLAWQHYHNGDTQAMRELKGIIQDTITNTTTESLITEILGKLGTEAARLKGWDHRHTFEKGDEGFEVLLGSQNGRATAFLLLQHREQLGRKEVSSIHLWEGGNGFWSLMLEIGDV